MAYASKEVTKKIREALKAEFGKAVKFGVNVNPGYHSLTVVVKESPFFDTGTQRDVNQFWIETHYKDNPQQCEFLTKVNNIIKTAGEWYDRSDAMTDYFDCAFYYDIKIGKWDKPHVKTS